MADKLTLRGLDVEGVADGEFSLSVLAGKASAWAATEKTLYDAKGDILIGTADNTRAKLPVGSDGQVLTADSTQSTGVKWAVSGGLSDPTTTKGDLIARSSSAISRLGVGTDGYVLTADSSQALGMRWAVGSSSGGVVVINSGGSVPGGTPSGSIIYEKPADHYAVAATLSPVILLNLDQTTSTFTDAGSNAAAFTAGSGVTRGKSPLSPGETYSVSGSGTAAVATLTGNPASLTGGTGTLMALVKIPGDLFKGTLIKAAGSSTTGWSLDVGTSGGGATLGRSFTIGRNGINWLNTSYTLPDRELVCAVCLTRDNATNTFNLWVNGVKVFTGTGTINAITGNGPALGTDNSAGGNFLSSNLDIGMAAWWGSVLSDANIVALTRRGGFRYYDGTNTFLT